MMSGIYGNEEREHGYKPGCPHPFGVPDAWIPFTWGLEDSAPGYSPRPLRGKEWILYANEVGKSNSYEISLLSQRFYSPRPLRGKEWIPQANGVGNVIRNRSRGCGF